MSWYSNELTDVEKINVDPDQVLKTVYSLMNKKHVSRIFYYLSGLTDESKEKIPAWVWFNINSWFGGEHKYLSTHFFPSVIKKRIEGVINGGQWLGFININGGYQSLDILLHSVYINGSISKVIERIYYNKDGVFGEKLFFDFVEKNDIKLKVPDFLGCVINDEFCFIIHEYIDGGRHPKSLELNNGLRLEIMKYFWSNAYHGDRKEFDNSRLDALMCNAGNHPLFEGKNDLFALMLGCSRASLDIIFHEDLNPKNIIIDEDDYYIIDWMDWGFLKIGMGVYFCDVGLNSGSELSLSEIRNALNRVYEGLSGLSWVEFICNFTIFNFINFQYYRFNPCNDQELGLLLNLCADELVK